MGFKLLFSQAMLDLSWWTALQAALQLAPMVRYHANKLQITVAEAVLHLITALSSAMQSCPCSHCSKSNALSSSWGCSFPNWWTIVRRHKSAHRSAQVELDQRHKWITASKWLCWLFASLVYQTNKWLQMLCHIQPLKKKKGINWSSNTKLQSNTRAILA